MTQIGAERFYRRADIDEQKRLQRSSPGDFGVDLEGRPTIRASPEKLSALAAREALGHWTVRNDIDIYRKEFS